MKELSSQVFTDIDKDAGERLQGRLMALKNSLEAEL